MLLKCTGSLVLPATEDVPSEENTRSKIWGTAVHCWKETGELKGPKRAIAALEKAIKASGIVRADYWPDEGKHEGAVAIRVDGVREVSRDDTPRDGWVTGHYDYTYWMFDDILWVDDLKTGKFYPNPPFGPGHVRGLGVGDNRFPQRPDSPQLKSYALALSALLGHDGPVIQTVTHWPRLPLSRRHSLPVRLTHETHSSKLLVDFWGELEAMYAEHKANQAAMRGEVDALILKPGDHCKFCPGRLNCLVAEVKEKNE